MTPEDINKTAWEVWAKARKEVMCADQVAILAAALVAERERDRWLPAETMKADAPKFGEHFLVYSDGGERIGDIGILPSHIGLARYVPDDKAGWKLETDWQFRGVPTLWQPLRFPPSTDKAEKP